MAGLFTVIIRDKETKEVLWDHISQEPDDTLHVDVYSGKDSLIGEFRKIHHLQKEINDNHPNLELISKDFGDVDVEELNRHFAR